ncbi:hypothetical protein DXG01_009484 [Tephrocybe rancida]|nr:hypothetical protein DXG01_009484 [Tephrocybe rancida]
MAFMTALDSNPISTISVEGRKRALSSSLETSPKRRCTEAGDKDQAPSPTPSLSSPIPSLTPSPPPSPALPLTLPAARLAQPFDVDVHAARVQMNGDGEDEVDLDLEDDNMQQDVGEYEEGIYEGRLRPRKAVGAAPKVGTKGGKCGTKRGATRKRKQTTEEGGPAHLPGGIGSQEPDDEYRDEPQQEKWRVTELPAPPCPASQALLVKLANLDTSNNAQAIGELVCRLMNEMQIPPSTSSSTDSTPSAAASPLTTCIQRSSITH